MKIEPCFFISLLLYVSLSISSALTARVPPPPPNVAVSSGKIGWIGLGAMGKHMAKHLQKRKENVDQYKPFPTIKVWNRTPERCAEHTKEYGTVAFQSLRELSRECSIIFLSMPTTTEVMSIVESLSELEPGSIIVDTTSGVPGTTRELAKSCLKERGVYFLDCPVSGGPAGAMAGTLTCMLGGDEEVAVAITPLLDASFAGKTVYCGPSGSGMAVKAINNVLMSAHLLLGAEGLLCLKNFGVEPDVALSVINASSGRSLQTEERIPKDVLSGEFGFGFKLALMAKDCRIASSIAKEQFPDVTLLPEVSKQMNQAEAMLPMGSDVTEAVKILEERAGTHLRCL